MTSTNFRAAFSMDQSGVRRLVFLWQSGARGRTRPLETHLPERHNSASTRFGGWGCAGVQAGVGRFPDLSLADFAQMLEPMAPSHPGEISFRACTGSARGIARDLSCAPCISAPAKRQRAPAGGLPARPRQPQCTSSAKSSSRHRRRQHGRQAQASRSNAASMVST
jgi:hypothetical protein